ncbi:hemolysin C [Leminorella grimontii]|uniref:RTX toxin-activating lysine-acyltransferase n=1 Tax=Leminorella grimontii TaxID=82981 RepID=A0AAV5N8N8_9GAMM|nr:toxin-activating lysine-acyltransferase [Leminorella grimontii]GKX57151.1 hemolysin C [Leminorella grimontii]
MMKQDINVIAPALTGKPVDEAFILGSAVWLWMHSPLHRETPLLALQDVLLPAIKHRQFVMAFENNRPVFYLSWAKLNEATESRYLQKDVMHLATSEWDSGERLWFIDWIAPFGHTRAMNNWVRSRLFAGNFCARSVYHRQHKPHGKSIQQFRGVAVPLAVATHWFDSHPVSFGLQKTLSEGTQS